MRQQKREHHVHDDDGSRRTGEESYEHECRRDQLAHENTVREETRHGHRGQLLRNPAERFRMDDLRNTVKQRRDAERDAQQKSSDVVGHGVCYGREATHAKTIVFGSTPTGELTDRRTVSRDTVAVKNDVKRDV